MKIQKCYNLDKSVVESLELFKSEKGKSNSHWVELAVVEFVKSRIDDVEDEGRQSSIKTRIDPYFEPIG